MPILTHVLSDAPEVEYLDGVRYRKMSPKRRHGRLQFFLTRVLEDQGGSFGEVVPEWRCRVGMADGTESLFVPDVAWAGDDRLSQLSDDDVEEPPFAPDIAIEVRSPGDKLGFLRRKIARYLTTGAKLVLDIDPKGRQVIAHTNAGAAVFQEGAPFTSAAVPWFSFDVTALFAAAERHSPG